MDGDLQSFQLPDVSFALDDCIGCSEVFRTHLKEECAVQGGQDVQHCQNNTQSGESVCSPAAWNSRLHAMRLGMLHSQQQWCLRQ